MLKRRIRQWLVTGADKWVELIKGSVYVTTWPGAARSWHFIYQRRTQWVVASAGRLTDYSWFISAFYTCKREFCIFADISIPASDSRQLIPLTPLNPLASKACPGWRLLVPVQWPSTIQSICYHAGNRAVAVLSSSTIFVRPHHEPVIATDICLPQLSTVVQLTTLFKM